MYLSKMQNVEADQVLFYRWRFRNWNSHWNLQSQISSEAQPVCSKNVSKLQPLQSAEKKSKKFKNLLLFGPKFCNNIRSFLTLHIRGLSRGSRANHRGCMATFWWSVFILRKISRFVWNFRETYNNPENPINHFGDKQHWIFIFLAIATHKFVVVFCVGLDLATNDTALSSFIMYMITLALATPLGIGAGIAITESSLLPDPAQHSITVNALQGKFN